MSEDQLVLKKDHVKSLLRKIAKDYELVAPVKNPWGDTLFEVVSSIDDVRLDLESKPVAPPKEFLLPREETLFNYKREGKEYRFEEVLPDVSRVLFGLRSCDLWAILFLDVVFQQDFKDRYYLNRRSNTILINIGCSRPKAGCFCRSAKAGPFLTHGYDLQLTDLGDRYFVEIGRPRGRDLVEKWNYFFEPAGQEDKDAQYEAVLEAESKFDRVVDFDTAISRLMDDEVDEAVWRELGNRCQGCGGCAYLCPTCYCFNIVDRPVSDTEGKRVRTHDACTLAGFTRLAGGHNPRHEGRRRIQRRFNHKLAFAKQKYNRPSCVGCGRCVEVCFGGIDMIRFIDMVCGQPERSRKASLRLGEILVGAGVINEEELKTALERQAVSGKALGTQLVDDRIATMEQIALALSVQLGFPETVATGGQIGR